jgi:tetratricopeptide (TPR) repeat protein
VETPNWQCGIKFLVEPTAAPQSLPAMICSRDHHVENFFIALTSALLTFSIAIASAQASPEQAPFWKIEGTVQDLVNSPIPGASVHLEKTGSISQETTTDVAGKFVIASPGAGTYVLRIHKTGFRDSAESIVVPAKQPGPLAIVLVRSESQPKSGESSEPMQFSENTDFTVAGITDWTAAGGHGSDVNLRTSEALAKETRGLAGITSNEAASGKATNSEDLVRKRDQLRKMLASSERAGLHRQLGDIDEQMNDALAAVHEYERAVQLDPSEQNYFAWATELLLHRAIQPSVQVFTKGATAYPGSERMLAGFGAALYASGLYAQAAERLCAASDLNPNDVTPYLFLGKMVQASSQPLPCSEEKLERFLNEYPENAFASYYYALALWKRAGQPRKSSTAERVEDLLKKSVSIDPKFAEAYLQLGIVYAASGQVARAVTAYESARAADPDLAEAHFRLGQAYKTLNQRLRAHQEFEAYERIQNTKAAAIEQQRREIQQFVVVFKDQTPASATHTP